MTATIVVFGGTGMQGGGVVRDLLAKGGYNIVVPTRKPSSEKAAALAAQGVTVVECDQHNQEQVKAALKGADYVFAVTNFWEPSGWGQELQLGSTMADAAKEAEVKLFMWSSLPNALALSEGKLDVPHLTDKAKVADYAASIGLPTVCIGAAFYYSNFRYFFPPRQAEDGTLEFHIPANKDLQLACFDAADMGKAVVMILEEPDKYKGDWIPVAGEVKTISELMQDFSDVTGKKAVHVSTPKSEFKAAGTPGAEELGCMFEFFEAHSVFGPHDVAKSPTGCATFKDWLKQTGWTGTD